MVQFNFAKREVQCKVVYYGPARSGKTANLRSIHERAPESVRGQLTSIATDTNRTLFFDFLPLNLGELAGIRTKVHIYAIPYIDGQNAMRLLVLEGVDGIVFVADSSVHQLERNAEALENLQRNLASIGRDIADIPLIWQWNKSDLPDAMPAVDLEQALNPEGHPAFTANAEAGTGVFSTLKAMTQAVLVDVAKVMASAPAETAAPVRVPAPPAPQVVPEPEPEPVLARARAPEPEPEPERVSEVEVEVEPESTPLPTAAPRAVPLPTAEPVEPPLHTVPVPVPSTSPAARPAARPAPPVRRRPPEPLRVPVPVPPEPPPFEEVGLPPLEAAKGPEPAGAGLDAIGPMEWGAAPVADDTRAVPVSEPGGDADPDLEATASPTFVPPWRATRSAPRAPAPAAGSWAAASRDDEDATDTAPPQPDDAGLEPVVDVVALPDASGAVPTAQVVDVPVPAAPTPEQPAWGVPAPPPAASPSPAVSTPQLTPMPPVSMPVERGRYGTTGVAGPAPRGGGWDDVAPPRPHAVRDRRPRHDVIPVRDRRRVARIQEDPQAVSDRSFAVGSALALISLIAIGILVHVLL